MTPAVAAYGLLVAVGKLNADALSLPVTEYDPNEHYESVSWMPWGPWIAKDYPDSTKVPESEMPGGNVWHSFVPDIDVDMPSLPSLFDDKDEKDDK